MWHAIKTKSSQRTKFKPFLDIIIITVLIEILWFEMTEKINK